MVTQFGLGAVKMLDAVETLSRRGSLMSTLSNDNINNDNLKTIPDTKVVNAEDK